MSISFRGFKRRQQIIVVPIDHNAENFRFGKIHADSFKKMPEHKVLYYVGVSSLHYHLVRAYDHPEMGPDRSCKHDVKGEQVSKV